MDLKNKKYLRLNVSSLNEGYYHSEKRLILPYGSLGEYPTNWIKKNAPSKKSFFLFSIFDLKIRMDESLKSNMKKSIFIDYGIIIFILSLCLFYLAILFYCITNG